MTKLPDLTVRYYQCTDPKLLFSDPTSNVITDPDPTCLIITNPDPTI
jgi:hypothetical protein